MLPSVQMSHLNFIYLLISVAAPEQPQRNYLALVELLLARGADVNHARNGGDTPLYIACEMGTVPMVQALLEAGAEVNKAYYDGATPLLKCCEQGLLDVALLLLDKDADVNQARGARRAVRHAAPSALPTPPSQTPISPAAPHPLRLTRCACTPHFRRATMVRPLSTYPARKATRSWSSCS